MATITTLLRSAALTAGLALVSCTTVPQLDLPVEAAHLNVGAGGLALGGYDPLTYFVDGGDPSPGDAAIEAEYYGLTYRFVDAANRDRFLTDPERFLPAYGGWCAWAMADGDKVEIDPESFLIEDGRLLLFYDGFWGDTRAQWLDAGGSAALGGRADEAWSSILAG